MNTKEIQAKIERAQRELDEAKAELQKASDWHPTERGVKVQPVPPFCGPWECALMRARRDLRLSRYSLDEVAGALGLSRSSDTHGALEDAVLAGSGLPPARFTRGRAWRCDRACLCPL